MLTPPQALEALLFAVGEPLTKKQAAALLEVSTEQLEAVSTALEESLKDRGLALVQTDTHLELRTSADAAVLVKKLREGELSRDLGKAGLETLAVILYRNGATRTDIDWLRGVNSSQTVRTLLMRGLIERIEDPADKRKFRYRATTEALAHLGISSADELPQFAELSANTDAAIAASADESTTP